MIVKGLHFFTDSFRFCVLAFSFGLVTIIVLGFLFESSYAEYDCSAKDDGWYYDPDFCHIYWRCIHGASEEFECASGTAWDHHENRCNWLDTVDCSRAEKTTKSASDYDDVDDGQNHDDADDETPIVVVKKEKKKKKKNRKTNSDKRMLNGDGSEEIDGKHLFLLIVCQTKSYADFLCAGRDGFFADPEYCTRYYRCSHGNDEVFECPRGTAWDEVSKTCSWVEQVDCDQKKLGYSTSTLPEDTTTTRKKSDVESPLPESNIASATNGKETSGSGSAVECQPTGIYTVADSVECNFYYQCDKGVRTRHQCPEQKFFDIEKRECNDHERVSCGTRIINSSQNQCFNKRDGTYADIERDCHYYFQCLTQKKVREAKCLDHQRFSIYTGKCGSASYAPAPCGSFVPGNSAIKYQQNLRSFTLICVTMVVFVVFNIQ